MLTSAWGSPWTQSGLSSAVQRVKNVTPGWEDRDLHFHDLRGTAATRFYKAGLERRVIAEIMGWEEAHVGKIIRRYVDRTAATRTVIEQMKVASKPASTAITSTDPDREREMTKIAPRVGEYKDGPRS